MSIVTLTFISSGPERISGIPKFVDILADGVATIYYTLDGTLPSPVSTVYTGTITMPTDVMSVTLSAVGYFSDGYGLVPTTVLSNRYGPDWGELYMAKYLAFDGIIYMYPGGLNIPYWYDANGVASVFMDIPPEDITFKISDRDEDGTYRPDDRGTNEMVIPSIAGSRYTDNFVEFSSDDDEIFNPEALFILIDGTKPKDPDGIVLVNGPNMSLRNPRRNFRGLDFYSIKNTNYISGSLTRYHINRDKGIIVFYYVDTNSGRWVKSIQRLENTNNTVQPFSQYRTPLVFRWNNYRPIQN